MEAGAPMPTLFDPHVPREPPATGSPCDADHPSRWPTGMRYLRRSVAVRLRGSRLKQPRGTLGLLRPSRRGSSLKRDNAMIMDHDIARDDYELGGQYLLPSARARLAQRSARGRAGPSAFPVARPSQRERLLNRRDGYTQKARASAVRRSTFEPESTPTVASARFSSTCTRRARCSGR